MTTIDPTARIEDGAVIGEGTSIGPYCVIGRHVVIGANCKLIAHVHITAQTTIGDGCTIYPFVSLGTPPQSLSYRGELTGLAIGQGCTIREQVTMNAGTMAGGGITRVGERGYFVQPTVLTNTTGDMKVVREEIFGPVVCAIPFDSPDEIIAPANDTNYGLAAGVFTRDISKAHRTAKRLRAGTVWINTYHVFDAAMPFGGYKQSGWGREMGHQVLNNYLETKSVVTAL